MRCVVCEQSHPSHLGSSEVGESFAEADFVKDRQGGCRDELTTHLSPRKSRLFRDGDRPSAFCQQQSHRGARGPAPDYQRIMCHESLRRPTNAPRHKAVGKQHRWPLVQLPLVLFRPQGGYLVAVEACAHADDCVVSADVVAANRPYHLAGRERQGSTAWFACRQDVGPLRRQCKQSSQFCLREMMQEQIRGNHIDISGTILLKKLEDVRRDRFDSPPNCIEIPLCFGAHHLVPIEQDYGEPLPSRSQSPRDPKHEGAIARTKIEYISRSLPAVAGETPCHDPGLLHPGVDTSEI